MADINNKDLEEWFEAKYQSNTSTAEDRALFENAPNKDEFKSRMIEEERNRRLAEDRQNNTSDDRIRSLTSDDNEYELDKLRIDALQDIGALTAEQADNAKSSPENAINALNATLPKLNDEQFSNYESALTDRILDDVQYEDKETGEKLESDRWFSLIPPSILAQKYAEMSEILESNSASNEEKAKAQVRKDKIAARIDDLTDQMADQGQTQEGLYFSDITNIADVKDGYEAMFAVRTHDLEQVVGNQNEGEWTPEREEAQTRITKMENCADILKAKMDEYESTHHIEELTPDDAKRVEERFDKIDETLHQVTLDDETLKLISNFKFYDEEGKSEPQFEFEDDKGNKFQSHEIPAGAKNIKIIEDSKLATVIQLAQQGVINDNLGTKEDITSESLKEQLEEKLFENLYAIHTAGEAVKGNYEKQDQLTNKDFLDKFVADLANPNKACGVTPVGFGAGVDACVNANAAFAAALNNKLVKEEQPKSTGNFWSDTKNKLITGKAAANVTSKLMSRMADIDRRAAARFDEKKASKWKMRGKMAKRLLMSAGMAFAVSTTMTVAAAAAPALATAAMATAAVAGVTLTSIQLAKWNKQRKASGGKPGFGNACKDLIKDRRMLLTMGATALGTAAIAMAGTDFGISTIATVGGVGLNAATVAGLGAMAVNATNVGMDAHKQGLGIAESVVWGVGTGATTLGAGYLGRLAGAGIVDWVNNNTNSHIFKHEETSSTTRYEREEHRYFKPGTEAQSDDTLRAFCTDEKGHFNQALYDAKRAQMETFVNDHQAAFERHGYDLANASQKNTLINRLATEYGDALNDNFGVDNLHATQNVNVDVHSGGNHFVLTDKVMAAHGLTGADRQAYLDMFTSSNPRVIEQGLNFFDHTQQHVISGINEINYTDAQTNAAAFDHHKLHQQAVPDATGDLHHADTGATKYDTYVKTDGALDHTTIIHKITTTIHKWIPNDIPWAIGTLGILGSLVRKKKTLKPRPGAAADKIQQTKPTQDPIPTPTPAPAPAPDPIPTPDEAEDIKKRVKERKQIDALLEDEYKFIYGQDPNPEKGDGKIPAVREHFESYKKRVKAKHDTQDKDTPMLAFLQARRKTWDDFFTGEGEKPLDPNHVIENMGKNVIKQKVGGKKGTLGAAIGTMEEYADRPQDEKWKATGVKAARASLMESNLTAANYHDKIDFTDFTFYTREALQKKSTLVAASRSHPTKDQRANVADLNDFFFGADKDASYEERIKARSDKPYGEGGWDTKAEGAYDDARSMIPPKNNIER